MKTVMARLESKRKYGILSGEVFAHLKPATRIKFQEKIYLSAKSVPAAGYGRSPGKREGPDPQRLSRGLSDSVLAMATGVAVGAPETG